MWFKREIRILRDTGKQDEAVEALCRKYNISIAHAEEIVRNLDDYQWHDRRDPDLDRKVKKFLADNKFIAAVREVNVTQKGQGLLSAKLYVEDIRDKKKPWPPAKPREKTAEQLLDEIFGGK